MEQRTNAICEGRSRKPVVSWAPVTTGSRIRRSQIAFVPQILEQKRDCSQSSTLLYLFDVFSSARSLSTLLRSIATTDKWVSSDYLPSGACQWLLAVNSPLFSSCSQDFQFVSLFPCLLPSPKTTAHYRLFDFHLYIHANFFLYNEHLTYIHTLLR